MVGNVYETREPEYYDIFFKYFQPTHPPILDLGAGNGLFLEMARKRGIEGYGVELLPNLTAICHNKGLNVVQHDLRNPLPFEDERFGMIFCNQVIEHVAPETQTIMLREAYRVLKRGGQLQIRSPCRHNEPQRLEKGHIACLTPSELKVMLQQAGFVNVSLEINFPQTIPEIPNDAMWEIWNKYHPDILSASANALCVK